MQLVCNMKHMKSYYDVRAVIRYYGELPDDVEQGKQYVTGTLFFDTRGSDILASDPFPASSEEPIDLSRWREPPHYFFANMSLDTADLGPTYQFTKRYGYLVGYIDVAGGRFLVDVAKMAGLQDLIRRAWAADETAIEELERDLAPEVRLSVRAKEIEIGVSDLWTLIRLLFLRDYAAKRTRVCANPDCPAPCFIQTRKGRKFCSHKCAVLINVRRFREAQRKAHHKSRTSKSKRRPSQ
jgi:hypothetical protein